MMTGGAMVVANQGMKAYNKHEDRRASQQNQNNDRNNPYNARDANQRNTRKVHFATDEPQIYQSQQSQNPYQPRDMNYNSPRPDATSTQRPMYMASDYPTPSTTTTPTPIAPMYLANDNAWAPLPRGYIENQACPNTYPWESMDSGYGGYRNASPPYGQRQQQQQVGFVMPEDQSYQSYQNYQEPPQAGLSSRGLPSALPALLQQGMNLAMARGESGKKAGGLGQLAGLFSR